MAKKKVTGWIREPLAAVLGTRAKVVTLRILWRAATPLPYREVVRRSGMAYGSIDRALGELTTTGVVEELEGGRERRVRLRTAHRLAAALGNLLQVESDFFSALRIELRTVAQGCEEIGLLTAALTGAVARREELLGSAVDLLLIVRDAKAVSRCVEQFETLDELLAPRFGVQLQVIAYDLATAQTMWRTRTAAAERNVREAEHVMGAPLLDVLSKPAKSQTFNDH